MQNSIGQAWRRGSFRYFQILVWLSLGIFFTGCIEGSNPNTYNDAQVVHNKKLVQEKFFQWKNGKGNFFDLLDEQVVWTVAGKAPYSGTYQNKHAFIEQAVIPITQKLKTPIEPKLISITAEADVVWLNWTGKATTIKNTVYENHYAWMMTIRDGRVIKATAFLDTYELYKLTKMKENNAQTMEASKAYIGMWVTADGYIRHELLPNNRYDEARGNKISAYQGIYQVTGNHIDYKDDTGFTADGEFKNDILYHAGMILYKEK